VRIFDNVIKLNVNPLDIPKVGDIIVAFPKSRYTYTMLQNLNKSDKRLETTWGKNKKAMVLDAIVDGKALIMKVVYEK